VIENLSRRGTADAYPAPLRNAPNAALLIDFDNVTMGVRSDLQLQLKRMLNSEVFKGKISVQRAYADWRRYPQYIVPLSEASIDLIFAPAFGSNKKNATDIRLAIDALELVFTRPEIGTFILLSGDSDFSSLVLKLKEYGKYIIGVGIRESSSDLLIQNCDEYFSYNELTGLLKEGEVEHRRRDPWELVVAAVTKMQQGEDVMRSDRLKQVMQELDPSFSEKDAGFSKYSKFLQEAARRGLLKLNKLENGQYEIVLGANANVPPDVERAARESESDAERVRASRRRGGRGGRGGGRGGSGGSSGSTAAGPSAAAVGEGVSLAEAFDLLRRALTDIGAVGEESTDADQARERMGELSDAEDPIFESRRFHRFLRQAHDAGMIDLVKSDDGAYLLRLHPAPVQADAGDEGAAVGGDDDAAGRPRRGERGERGGRSRRGRRRREEGEPAEGAAEVGTARGDLESRPSRPEPRPPVAEPPVAQGGEPRRNPRFRHGSRAGSSAPVVTPPPDSAPPTPSEPPVHGPVSHSRSLRGRGGRRGAPTGGGGQPAGEAAAPAPRVEPRTPPPVPESAAAPAEPAERKVDRPAARERPEPEDQGSDADTGGGLFKRMSAALQRAMLGQNKDEPPQQD
jgi:uncharacterized protein (TIGR00288 family)